ncbi:putative gustatory receptor 28b [Neocloeon triangulifer]|uniref:putative gustatory receptor 28b n=1 Tax=Neocloeon triangulifer TaxID=2078957 RepID=UPI00286F6A81|nr:putative gustatory receptor 28b [Neocloeon triangulifer]
MERVFLRKSSRVLGLPPEATVWSRVYSLVIFLLVTLSCLHVLYKSGLEPLLDRRSDVTLSIAYIFDFMARTARVISYIIMHLLTYKHAGEFDKIYQILVSTKYRVTGDLSKRNNDAILFTVVLAMIRVMVALGRVVFRSTGQPVSLLNTFITMPFHLKFIFNFYMELQLFTLCSELDHSFDSISHRLKQLRKNCTSNSITDSGLVLVDKWRLPMMQQLSLHTTYLASYASTVRNLRRAHSTLSSLTAKVNALFGVRLLVDVTAQLTALLLRLKIIIIWIFSVLSPNAERVNEFANAIELERAASALVLCPVHIGTVYAVVYFCTRTVKKNDLILAEVHKLLNHSLEEDNRQELQIFAMQLSQRKVQFTAAGVMPLDFSLLYSFMGVVTTYLVILIQFGASVPRYANNDSKLCVDLLKNFLINATAPTSN